VPTGGGNDPLIDKPIMQDMVTISGGLFKESAPDASNLSDVIVDIVNACGGAGGTGITSLTIDPLQLFLSNGETGDVTITNFNPARKGEVTKFSAAGLPDDSSITFAPVTINKDATENEVMHVNIGPTTQAGTY